MFLKKTIKFTVYFLLSIGFILFIIIIYFGGLGKKKQVYTNDIKRDKPLLFAHRGVCVYYPENSIEGVEGAKKLGFKAAEADIRRTSDNQNIVFHDETATRLLGLEKNVDELTLDEFKGHPIFLRKGGKSNSYVSTLEEFLKTEQQDIVFYLDMKFSSFEEADEVVALIKKYNCEKTVILTNWDIFFVFYVEANYPEIITCLEGFDAGKEWTYDIMPKDLKPDYLSGFFSNTDEDHIHWLNENELMNNRIVYGVDSTNYDAVLKAGFKNIIIDFDSNMCKDPRIVELLHS